MGRSRGFCYFSSDAHPALVHSLGYVAPLAARDRSSDSARPELSRSHWAAHGGSTADVPVFCRANGEARRARHHEVGIFRGEIVKHLPVSRAKVLVIHHGGREENETGASPHARNATSPVSKPYIMAFGSLSAHKNLGRLVAAFNSIASLVPHSSRSSVTRRRS